MVLAMRENSLDARERTPTQRLAEIQLGEDLEVWLQREYCLKERTVEELGEEIEVHPATVARWLVGFGLDRRSMTRKAAEEQAS